MTGCFHRCSEEEKLIYMGMVPKVPPRKKDLKRTGSMVGGEEENLDEKRTGKRLAGI